ncbi:PfkB family carbohydrate kinase [Moorella naiadis]|uniref:PfkB family carbohydrate kinase n=1 Tax=Moorella naiadis (nom. illeg.) TaxID=3093670 RepID=UPI003D9CA67E
MPVKSLDVVSVGEILIDFVGNPKGCPLAEVTDFRRAAGGGPANVAVGVARLGGRAGFIGKVGRDAFGEHLKKVLEENGVDTRGLLWDREANTTLVFVALNEKAVPEFVFFRHETADTRMDPAELPQEVLGDTRILHFSSVSLTVEPARSATLEAVRIARAAGAVISFDPNLRLSLWPDQETARRNILQAAGRADIIKLNEEELAFLTGCPTLADGIAALLSGKLFSWELSADQCTGRVSPPGISSSNAVISSSIVTKIAPGPRLIAVTRGAAGAVLAQQGLQVAIPALPVTAVDTTGAGDAFMAGMLTALAGILGEGRDLTDLEERDLHYTGHLAATAAAITCTRPGAIPALPTKAEVEEEIRRNLSGTL